MTNLYATPAALKRRISIGDTYDDAEILAALAKVSRTIDVYCGRRFYVELRTRYYTPNGCAHLLIDDLLSVTTLKTDEADDRLYSTAWATTDYDLEPVNAPYESPPAPYTRIHLAPNGDYRFPGIARGVQIVGKWGYYEVLEPASSVANEIMDASETGFDVVDGTAFEVGQTNLVDSEQMYVSGISGNTLTVARGVNGTTAASHLNGATIQRYTYPIIGEACIQQAVLVFKTRVTGTGMMAAGEFQQQIVTAGLHPFVKNDLDPFRRIEVG
jgi:hypothetical protein